MFSPSRRSLLGATALLPVGMLASCASTTGTTSNPTPAQIIADASSLVTMLTASVNALTPSPISNTEASTLDGNLGSATKLLTTVSTSMAATQSAPILQEVEGILNAALQTLSAIPLIPMPYAGFIKAAAVLLPIVETWVTSITAPNAAAALAGVLGDVAGARRTLGIPTL